MTKILVAALAALTLTTSAFAQEIDLSNFTAFDAQVQHDDQYDGEIDCDPCDPTDQDLDIDPTNAFLAQQGGVVCTEDCPRPPRPRPMQSGEYDEAAITAWAMEHAIIGNPALAAAVAEEARADLERRKGSPIQFAHPVLIPLP